MSRLLSMMHYTHTAVWMSVFFLMLVVIAFIISVVLEQHNIYSFFSFPLMKKVYFSGKGWHYILKSDFFLNSLHLGVFLLWQDNYSSIFSNHVQVFTDNKLRYIACCNTQRFTMDISYKKTSEYLYRKIFYEYSTLNIRSCEFMLHYAWRCTYVRTCI